MCVVVVRDDCDREMDGRSVLIFGFRQRKTHTRRHVHSSHTVLEVCGSENLKIKLPRHPEIKYIIIYWYKL